MANTAVFTGADGSITLSAPKGKEGTATQDVIKEYDLVPVGRVQNVRVEVLSDVKAFHEIGRRYAAELRPGNVTVRGTIGRAFVNGALLKLLLGEAADAKPKESWPQPSLNITVLVENPAQPGVRNTLTLHEVKFDGWVYNMPEDDFVMESVSFQALFLTVKDEATGEK
jgi:hypothetical protein